MSTVSVSAATAAVATQAIKLAASHFDYSVTVVITNETSRGLRHRGYVDPWGNLLDNAELPFVPPAFNYEMNDLARSKTVSETYAAQMPVVVEGKVGTKAAMVWQFSGAEKPLYMGVACNTPVVGENLCYFGLLANKPISAESFLKTADWAAPGEVESKLNTAHSKHGIVLRGRMTNEAHAELDIRVRYKKAGE